MSARILHFPRSHPPADAAPQVIRRGVARPRVYSVAEVADQLAMFGEARGTIIAKLRLLARDQGFPLPRNPRTWAGVIQRGPSAIGSRSLWDAAAIDAWLAGEHEPNPPAAMQAPRPAPVSTEMRGRMAGRAALLAAGAR